MLWRDDYEILNALHSHQIALLGNGGFSADGFMRQQANAKDRFHDLVGMLRPWEGRTAKERQAKDVEKVTKQWEARFGHLKDPKVQEEIKRTAAAMIRRAALTAATAVDENYSLALKNQAAQQQRRLRITRR